MSIFQSKTKSHKDNNKLVGVHILKENAHRITLNAIIQNSSKSAILRKLIEDYLKNTPPLDKLIFTLIERVKKDWTDTVEKNKILSGWKTRADIRRQWWTYRAELLEDLKAKKIPKEIIQTISDEVEETI